MISKLAQRKFTLVELLTVVAIIGVLIGIVMGIMGLAMGKTAETRTKAALERLCVALENYKAKYGYYIQAPTATAFYLDYVDETVNAATETNADKITKAITNNFCQFIDFQNFVNKDCFGYNYTGAAIPTAKDMRYNVLDGYGFPILYRCPGYFNRNGFDIGSVGPDGKFGSTTNGMVFQTGANVGKLTTAAETNMKSNFGQGDDIVKFAR
jgi:prepilin-type N-terminal cleavage/methylation domain-containing protein